MENKLTYSKNQTAGIVLFFVAIAFALAAIFIGAGKGFYLKIQFGETVSKWYLESVWWYTWKSSAKLLIFPALLTILGTCGIGVLWILNNSKKKPNDKANFWISFGLGVAFVISAIFAFASKPIVWNGSNKDIYDATHLAWGTILTGVFNLLAGNLLLIANVVFTLDNKAK